MFTPADAIHTLRPPTLRIDEANFLSEIDILSLIFMPNFRIWNYFTCCALLMRTLLLHIPHIHKQQPTYQTLEL